MITMHMVLGYANPSSIDNLILISKYWEKKESQIKTGSMVYIVMHKIASCEVQAVLSDRSSRQ
jgi:hypothetical protein